MEDDMPADIWGGALDGAKNGAVFGAVAGFLAWIAMTINKRFKR